MRQERITKSTLVGPQRVALLVLAAVSPLFFLIPISHDAAWQMWIGRQLWFGRHLYSDIIEVNPPLWFWIAAPLSGAAKAFDIRSLAILACFLLFSVAISVHLSARLLPHWTLRRRALFLVTLVLVSLPITDFGQREQFTLIATLPYVILIGRRRDGAIIDRRLASAVGFFAAVGLALKPHFLLVSVALELWLWRSPRRPELAALSAALVAYAASVVVFTPDYLTSTVPLVREAYAAFGGGDMTAIFYTAGAFCFALPLLLRPSNTISAALTVAALAFFLAFILQAKGFAYHAIPARGCLLLAVAASELHSGVSIAVAFAVGLLTFGAEALPYRNNWDFHFAPTASYAALSTQPRATWPEVEEHQRRWPLRVMSLWMAAGIHDPEPMKAFVNHDLDCSPPDYLLVDDRIIHFSAMFPRVVSAYRAIWQIGEVRMMRRVGSLPKPAHCQPIY